MFNLRYNILNVGTMYCTVNTYTYIIGIVDIWYIVGNYYMGICV